MKALTIDSPGKLKFVEKPEPVPREGEVLVQIKAAALNHRDQWIREGKYPGIKYGTTLGSDASGIIVSAGSEEDQSLVGQEVVINPNINWGPNPAVQSSDYSILGNPTDGTFAECISVSTDKVVQKPGFLSMEQAAAYPLAGLTAYRALFTHGKLQAKQSVLINGAGGGVAQHAIKFSLATGALVDVTSGSQEKIHHCTAYGVRFGFDYNLPDWYKEAQIKSKGYDLIIDSVGGESFKFLVNLVGPGGKVVLYGASAGLPDKVDLYRLFWKQAAIQGSTMGNDQEFIEMIKFVEKHKIKPEIDSIWQFEDAEKAFDKMKESRQLGKLILKIA